MHPGLETTLEMPTSAMDVMLPSVCRELATIYLKDISLFSELLLKHTSLVMSIRLLYETGIILKLKKCNSFAETTDYNCHVIWLGCLNFTQYTNLPVTKLKYRNANTKIGSFLDLYEVFRLFVPNPTRISDLLNNNMRKNQPKQFCPVDGKRGAAVVPLEEPLLNYECWRLRELTAVHTQYQCLCKKGGCVLLQKKGYGSSRRVSY